MKVSVENVSSVKKVLHVEIPKKDVDKKLDKAYKTLKYNVKLKGFRPGKVPISFLEKRFKKEIQQEVSGELIQTSFSKALEKVELKPLGEPVLNSPQLKRGEAYQYSATVEVRPALENLNVKGMKLTKKVHTVTDDEINAQLKMLQKRNAQLKSVEEDRPVKDKDVVIIDYEGSKNGQPLQSAGKTENFQVELGSGRMLVDLEKQIVGMKRNEVKHIEVRFPDDYFNQKLAGLDAVFKVTLKEIKEEVLPKLDDEFAKDLGEYETLEELKQSVADNLDNTYKAQANRDLRAEIIDKLIEQSEFDVPEGLVEMELKGIVDDARSHMASRGIPVDNTDQKDAELKEKYRFLAEKKIREYLIIEKVIEQEGLALTEETLENAYENFATALGQPADKIKEHHSFDKEAFEYFKQKTLEKEAINYIINNSNVEEVEVDQKAMESEQLKENGT